MNDEEVQQRAREHVRKWYEVVAPESTMDTTIYAMMLLIATVAETAPQQQLRAEFLGHMHDFIDDLRAGRIVLREQQQDELLQ